jgi:hypothetical protein
MSQYPSLSLSILAIKTLTWIQTLDYEFIPFRCRNDVMSMVIYSWISLRTVPPNPLRPEIDER